MCNFPPRGTKVNSKFLPQHLSLTLMSCLPWNSTSPEAKITHSPQAATGVGEADAKVRQRAGRKIKQCWCSVCFWIDCDWCKTSFTLSSAAVAVVAVAHLDRDNLNANTPECPEHLCNVARADLHLNTQGQTRAAFGSLRVGWIAKGPQSWIHCFLKWQHCVG